MIRVYWFSLLSIWMFQHCNGQPAATPIQICTLPAELNESSALHVTAAGICWSLNDSGGDPVLYAFDTTGTLVDTIIVSGTSNRDWESLAVDKVGGRVFVGDFGNNSQGRQDLTVYWAYWDENRLTSPVQKMTFSYPDQTVFPAKDNFDCEGFFYWQDSLYLFSKNRTTGAGGYAKLYRLPVDTGFHQAVLVDSILLGAPVTGADIRDDGSQIALISYGLLYLIDLQPGQPFTAGAVRLLSIPFSQTEAVAYVSNDLLYFTNEQGQLYSLDVSVSTHASDLEDRSDFHLVPVGPAMWQVTDALSIKGLSVFDLSGRLVSYQQVVEPNAVVDLSAHPQGQYLVFALTDEGYTYRRLITAGQ